MINEDKLKRLERVIKILESLFIVDIEIIIHEYDKENFLLHTNAIDLKEIGRGRLSSVDTEIFKIMK